VIDPSAFSGWVRPISVCGLAAAALKIECGFAAMDFSRNAYRSERTYRDVRFAGADYYYAVFQVAGRSVFTQNDEVAQLAVGDIALLDAARPAACFADDSQWLRLQLPRQSLVSHLGCEPPGGLHARGETPAAHLLFDLVRNAAKGEGSAGSPAGSLPAACGLRSRQRAVCAIRSISRLSPCGPAVFAYPRRHQGRLCRSRFRPFRGRRRSRDLAALRTEALHGTRLDLQQVHIFGSIGSRRAPSASPGGAGRKPSAQRHRLCLWLSRLHPFRKKISPSVRLLARRSRGPWNSARPYRKKGATGTRRLASGCLKLKNSPAKGNDRIEGGINESTQPSQYCDNDGVRTCGAARQRRRSTVGRAQTDPITGHQMGTGAALRADWRAGGGPLRRPEQRRHVCLSTETAEGLSYPPPYSPQAGDRHSPLGDGALGHGNVGRSRQSSGSARRQFLGPRPS